MNIDKEREAFENLWLAGGGNFDNFIFSEDQGKYAAIENSNLTDKQKEMALYIVNNAYLFFVGGFKQAAKAQAVPEGFVLVPERNVHDHYIANHLKGTTCSVDVSELTGNDGDRIYGKLRPFDCLGSDGNTLIYDLESSNFNLIKNTGNTGDFVLVPKKPDVGKAWGIALKRIVPPPKTNDTTQKELMCKKYVDDLCSEQDQILLNYEAMIEAQEQNQ